MLTLCCSNWWSLSTSSDLPGCSPSGAFSGKGTETGSDHNSPHRCVSVTAGRGLRRYLLKTHPHKSDTCGLRELGRASQRSHNQRGPRAEASGCRSRGLAFGFGFCICFFFFFQYTSYHLIFFIFYKKKCTCLLLPPSISPCRPEEPETGKGRRRKERRQVSLKNG